MFALAGLSKLADLAGSRRALEAFGVPRRGAPGLAVVLPLAELAVSGVLLPSGTARAGALGSAALLSAFTIAIAVNLVRGRMPECRCFGQVHSTRVSWGTVARNVILTAAAVAIVVAGPGAGLAAIPAVAAGGAILLTALLLVGRRAATSASQEGLPVGTDAPAFSLAALDGERVTLATLRARGKPVLLVFADVHCGPCVALAPEIARWQQEHAGMLTVAVIERGHVPSSPRADEHGRVDVLVPENDDVASVYRAEGTPVAVLVDADARIASQPAPGAAAIRRLVAAQTGGPVLDAEPTVSHQEPLARREFLLRAASAAVSVGTVLVLPARAVAGTRRPASAEACPPGRKACGRKCCGPRQKCIRKAFGKPKCICNDGYSDVCPDGCAFTATDDRNCGKCGSECLPGQQCVGGKCQLVNSDQCPGGCPPNDDLLARWCCDGQCKDLGNDVDNCALCSRACTRGKKPTCCSGYCRDISSDPRHCGGCFKPCPTQGICHAGRCRDACPQPLKQCGETCYRPQTELCCNGRVVAKTDLQHDNDHCSANPERCGVRCPPGTACTNGRCCPEGQGFCGGSCVDTTSDNAHCGSQCEECNSSLAPECCGGECTNIGLNEEHCGACFNKCKPGEFCRFGECVCPLGETCG